MTVQPLKGTLKVPGDKSISHRAIMFSALATGKSRIIGLLDSADCMATADCFRKMGVSIEGSSKSEIIVKGLGLHGLKAPAETLNAQNSGTTTRLISGILAAQPFHTMITGDASIQKRPMKRIMEPLKQMGAHIVSVNDNGCAPLSIDGTTLSGITYHSPVASAQVKSCILLAGLYAKGQTIVTEPAISRDHTERMLNACGAPILTDENTKSVCVSTCDRLNPLDVTVPGDISSAAYFIAAASLIEGSEVRLEHVGINPTRDGILRVAKAMGADIRAENVRTVSGEPVADLIIRYAPLIGTDISGDLIPTLIDELPMIAVMAAFADGTTTIRDAAELRVKESDRIKAIMEGLTAMGADVTELPDGLVINGGNRLHTAKIKTYLDHRIAMSFAVAQTALGVTIDLDSKDCVRISYPDFFTDLAALAK
ncbi:MAG: 3-phosphoshikimate 1-carboxyvinyltransferase [Lachnospiraceae bacterium]|nr:3-phosphoshikimate 1-carboxyvinyltransferase [Lachnospiraceae bacterium]